MRFLELALAPSVIATNGESHHSSKGGWGVVIEKHVFDMFTEAVSKLGHECGVVPLEIRCEVLKSGCVMGG